MTESNHPTPFNWVAHYSFAFPKSDLRPEDQRWGNGSIPIQTDKVPETKEEFTEIAREIGRLGGYGTVALTKLDPTDHFIEDSGEILEGLIVND
jgi:hypothetical protein